MSAAHYHRCSRQHHAAMALARCTFPDAGWIRGDGPFGVVAWCSVVGITLYPTADAATAAHAALNDTGCGRRCTGHHGVLQLSARLGMVTVSETDTSERRPRLGSRPKTDRKVA